MLKRGDKQFRRSLKTKDRKRADRRLAELRAQVGNLTLSDDARLSFGDIATRWMNTTKHALKASTITRRETCIKNLSPFFAGVTIRNVQPKQCERWLTERGSQIAAQALAHELNAMRAIFDYAVRLGLMLSNPAGGIKRRKIVPARIAVPTVPNGRPHSLGLTERRASSPPQNDPLERQCCVSGCLSQGRQELPNRSAP